MSKENSFGKRAEVTAEKWGGGTIAVLGLLSLDFPAVAVGLALNLFGRFRGRNRTVQTA